MPDLILFVEDNVDFRDSAARFLELKGFDVEVASDGLEGLEHLQRTLRLPDVIVSDISMPRMNGYEFFEAVRQKPQWKGIPFIFLTALDSRADLRLGWELGVDEYLVKPFRPEDFLAIIRRILNRTRELRSIAEDQIQETRNMIVRILSHELRTPMTYVTGGFTLLADEINKQNDDRSENEREDIKIILNLIHNGTRRLNRLAEQMVMLAELTSSQSDGTWEHLFDTVNLANVIDSAISGLDSLVEEHRVTLEIEHLPSLYVRGVINLLVQAVGEPIRNAIQFSPNGARVQIRTLVDPDNPANAVIEIRDHGRGITPEDLETIWDLMRQSEREKYEQQGFGLGLSITQKIMQVHHGLARIESAINEGTLVRLYFPMIAPPEY